MKLDGEDIIFAHVRGIVDISLQSEKYFLKARIRA